MPTYVYETIPSRPGDKPKRFELKHSMADAPLKKHPETGEAIRRVISGGVGIVTKGKGGSSSSGSCGSGCGCH
ncbi:MAG: zinc ribbon domain-containing protein [Verrucomicrobiae bacterium]|nr:zinc ribbon domain-containing protein [Verrucomicrobiae bacterium]